MSKNLFTSQCLWYIILKKWEVLALFILLPTSLILVCLAYKPANFLVYFMSVVLVFFLGLIITKPFLKERCHCFNVMIKLPLNDWPKTNEEKEMFVEYLRNGQDDGPFKCFLIMFENKMFDMQNICSYYDMFYHIRSNKYADEYILKILSVKNNTIDMDTKRYIQNDFSKFEKLIKENEIVLP